jgi:pseudaminic acid cytidylyltransferase
VTGLAIIPARGGSKRIPRKNLLDIAGRPMLDRPITAARDAQGVADVIVSTDDDEIADLATELGATVPGRRPDHLAADDTPTAPVIAHEVERFTQVNGRPDFVIVLYPTSIFVTSADLDAMVARLARPDSPVQMVMTVTSYPAPIERAWTIAGDDIGVVADPSSRNRQSQEFREHFYDAGQAYVSTADAWLKVDQGLVVSTALHVLPPWRSWDINTPDDFTMAEILLRRTGKSG